MGDYHQDLMRTPCEQIREQRHEIEQLKRQLAEQQAELERLRPKPAKWERTLYLANVPDESGTDRAVLMKLLFGVDSLIWSRKKSTSCQHKVKVTVQYLGDSND